MYPLFAKLLEYQRNGLVEEEHSGLILHFSKEKVFNEIGYHNGYKFYQRSCMKPLQLARLIDLNIHKIYGFSQDEIAVMAASHTGDLEHQGTVKNILKKLDLDESYLLCPKHQPLSKKERDRLFLNNAEPLPIHNNCSGKHAAMLAICKHMGFPLNNYMDYNHPLKDLIISKILEICEVQNNDYVISKDGCGLPTVATSLYNLGLGFLNLFLNPDYSQIKNAYLNFPYLIGGEGRHDSEIINASCGKLVAKVGAGGLIVVVNIEKEECIVVKIADVDMNARILTTVCALKQLKWITENQINGSSLSDLVNFDILSLCGEKLGEIKPCFELKY